MFTDLPKPTPNAQASVEADAYEMEQGAPRPLPTRSSRYVRPAVRPPLHLQQRDRRILLCIFEYRYLSAEHIKVLIFPGASIRAVQMRLRKLWAHEYLDRQFISFLLDGTRPPPRHAARPFYMLSLRGAEVVAEERGLEVASIPHTPAENARGYATLEHHLVATDFFVAVLTACANRGDVEVVRVEQESKLRRTLAAYWLSQGQKGPAMVPDGALTLSFPRLSEHMTFYLEVVRSSVKGGNESLARRLRQYAAMHHQGLFRRLYQHDRLRAVLILTTSTARQRNLQTLSQELPHGRHLFWFGTYLDHDGQGREVSTLTPASILSPRWMNTKSEHLSLIPPGAGPPPEGSAAS